MRRLPRISLATEIDIIRIKFEEHLSLMPINKTVFSAAQRNIIYIAGTLSVSIGLLLKYSIQRFLPQAFPPVPMLDYICICLFLPVCIFALVHFLTRYCIPYIGKKYVSHCLGTASFLFFIFLILHIDWSIYYKWAPWNHKIYKSLSTYCFALLICLAVFFAALITWKGRARYWAVFSSAAGILCLSGYMTGFAVLNDWHIYNQNSLNFGVVLYPIVQTVFGKAILMDLNSQYGLYPQFLEPIFRITGLSILSVTSVLAFLLFISLLMTGLALWNVVRNKVLAVAGFAAFLFFHFLSASLWPYELYFQYYPIRTLFPAISLFAASYYFRYSSLKLYSAILFILSAGILWNLDVGTVAFLSFAGTDICAQLSRRRLTCSERIRLLSIRGFQALSILVATFSVYAFYLKLRYHMWPDFSRLFLPHGYFLRQYSLLTLNKSWILAALLYVFCLVYSIREILRRKTEYFNSMVLFLTLLGIGLFSYHANQYFDQVFSACGYPALLLLIVLTDRWLSYLKSRTGILRVSEVIFLLCSVFFISFCAAAFFLSLRVSSPITNAVKITEFYPINPGNQKVLWEEKTPFSRNSDNSVRHVQLKDIACGNPGRLLPPWKQRALLLKGFFAGRDIRNEKIVIFSMWDAWLYMEIGEPSALDIVNSIHLYVSKGWEKVAERLKEKNIGWIVLETDAMLMNTGKDGWDLIRRTLDEYYHLEAVLPVSPTWYGGWHDSEFRIYSNNGDNVRGISR